jgi:SAM-dependent methyltransferase
MTPEQYALFAEIERDHWWFVARREIMRTLLQRVLPPDQSRMVVDIGCGTGGNIAALAERYRCAGIDDSEHAIRLARERHPAVEFVRTADAGEIRTRLAEADAMLCMDVVEHVEHDADFLEMLVRAMRPGTQILLTVPADMSLWSEHDVTNHHFRRYSIDGFAALWQRLPVRTRLLSAFNARLYPMIKGARLVARARGRAHGHAGTDFSIPPAPVNALLEHIFRGERRALDAAVDRGTRPYRRGVSIVALLERTGS